MQPRFSLDELPQDSGPRPQDVKTRRRACNCGWSRASLVEVPDSRVGEMVVGVGVRGVWGDPSSSISVKNAFCADRVCSEFRVNFFFESRAVAEDGLF